MSDTALPVHLRLRAMIADGIVDGTYREGTMLPSVRSLAQREKANPLTVAKAYQYFQDEGLVTVQRGIGLFVADGAAERLRATMRRRFIEDEWPRIARRLNLLGLRVEDLSMTVHRN
ncbi:GntR family transcriptional regulator [Novosphingobium huizhouense]|uniref:GntR family transcriptional regulator n=1 Tax=Novosphingobium huizhouense TaxID=2866625 RepID=UPI001CD873B4|nr:GntR family transcriptional regulator [Novosphingobium huizhouense]